MEKPHFVAFGLGSNVGDMVGNLRSALDQLNAHPEIAITKASLAYRTPPWGETDQPWFLNACALGQTSLDPHDLLQVLKSTEQAIGRQARYRWGPREIDIDILLYDDLFLESEVLTLPHASMLERGFVMVPLAEIAPDHIIKGQLVKEAAQKTDTQGIEPLLPFWP